MDRRRANSSVFRRGNDTILEYMVFIYLTKTAFVEKEVQQINQKFPMVEGAPKDMRVTGFHVQMIKCRRCGRRGHTLSECIDPCLRIETCSSQQVAPALIAIR